MPARTSTKAVEAFLAPLRAAASCVTQTPVIGTGYRPARPPHLALFASRGQPVRLRGPLDVTLTLRVDYVIVDAKQGRDRWTVDAVGYSHVFEHTGGRELILFHWHPVGHSPIRCPHLHVATWTGPTDLTGAHVPTGLIGVEAVIWFAIAELGVRPLRSAWQDLLGMSGTSERTSTW